MSIFDHKRKQEIRDEVRKRQLGQKRGEIEGRASNDIPAGPDNSATRKQLGKELLEASLRGNYMKAAILIHKGADVSLTDEHGRNPLLLFVQHSNHALVELLISKGADPNSRDSSGRTALIYAASGQSRELCELLLARGADPSLLDCNGAGVMQYARENPEIADTIKRHTAKGRYQ